MTSLRAGSPLSHTCERRRGGPKAKRSGGRSLVKGHQEREAIFLAASSLVCLLSPEGGVGEGGLLYKVTAVVAYAILVQRVWSCNVSFKHVIKNDSSKVRVSVSSEKLRKRLSVCDLWEIYHEHPVFSLVNLNSILSGGPQCNNSWRKRPEDFSN